MQNQKSPPTLDSTSQRSREDSIMQRVHCTQSKCSGPPLPDPGEHCQLVPQKQDLLCLTLMPLNFHELAQTLMRLPKKQEEKTGNKRRDGGNTKKVTTRQASSQSGVLRGDQTCPEPVSPAVSN